MHLLLNSRDYTLLCHSRWFYTRQRPNQTRYFSTVVAKWFKTRYLGRWLRHGMFGSGAGIISLIEAKPELQFYFSAWVQTPWAFPWTWPWAADTKSHHSSPSTRALRSKFSQSSAAIHRYTIGFELQNLKEARIRNQILRECIRQIKIRKKWSPS